MRWSSWDRHCKRGSRSTEASYLGPCFEATHVHQKRSPGTGMADNVSNREPLSCFRDCFNLAEDAAECASAYLKYGTALFYRQELLHCHFQVGSRIKGPEKHTFVPPAGLRRRVMSSALLSRRVCLQRPSKARGPNQQVLNWTTPRLPTEGLGIALQPALPFLSR